MVQFELSLAVCNVNNFRPNIAIYQHPLLLSNMLSRCVYVGVTRLSCMVTVVICMFGSTQYKDDCETTPRPRLTAEVSLRVHVKRLEKLESASVADGSSTDIQEERSLH